MTKKISLPVIGEEKAAANAGLVTRATGGTVMDEIASEVKANPIALYMKGTLDQPMCGFSHRASEILRSFGKPVYAVNILDDPEKRQAIKEFSEWPTIPQVYVNGEFLGGSDILTEMYQAGELKALIDQVPT